MTEFPRIRRREARRLRSARMPPTYGLINPAPKASFVIRQGVEMGRPSEIHVEVTRKDSGAFAIRIGGRCAIVGEGSMFL